MVRFSQVLVPHNDESAYRNKLESLIFRDMKLSTQRTSPTGNFISSDLFQFCLLGTVMTISLSLSDLHLMNGTGLRQPNLAGLDGNALRRQA
ncbi:hypothetical protein CLCR_11194 [Cladophialophora carrionii]|uniref:Uncharacterized protein n=1 Tax=Cladophialophora carrionii TaxID=86049 RepID=A0A1C1C6R7_9EURO|nr:hypothetical protein CLCR_11194 [Cladophialophora carrionii]